MSCLCFGVVFTAFLCPNDNTEMKKMQVLLSVLLDWRMRFMFKGIVFFIKNGWKYDKLYIIWRLLFQFINSLLPIVAVIIPKYILDELMSSQNVKKLIFLCGCFSGIYLNCHLFVQLLELGCVFQKMQSRCRV